MTSDVVLDDATFIGSAGYLLERRLQAYTQSLSPGETTTPSTTVPGNEIINEEEEVTPSNIPTYLAVRCEDEQSLLSILNTLDSAGRYAVFFLTPEQLKTHGTWPAGCWAPATAWASWLWGRTGRRRPACWRRGSVCWQS